MKKFLLFVFLLSASVFSGSAASPKDAGNSDFLLPRPVVNRPQASYYHVRLEASYFINVFCYVGSIHSQIEVECNDAIYAMDVTNLSTGESSVTRANGATRATVNVSDYHGRWQVNIWLTNGTVRTGEIVL